MHYSKEYCKPGDFSQQKTLRLEKITMNPPAKSLVRPQNLQRMNLTTNDNDDSFMRNVFPENIWHRILGNVYTPQDYNAIKSASTTFKRLLCSHHNRFLMGDILPHLQRYMGKNRKKIVLKLRLVCKSWQIGVDNFLDKLPENFLVEEDATTEYFRNDPRPRRRYNYTKSLSSICQIRAFCAKFDATHLPKKRNPIVGRSIMIRAPTENFSRYLETLLEVLWKYGSHVWYCHLCVAATSGQCDWLKDILVLLPSLRKLDILMSTGKPFSDTDLQRLKQYHGQARVPTFPNMQMLREVNLPLTLLLDILQANPHINTLNTAHLGDAINRPPHGPRAPRNLERLEIRFRNLDQFNAFEMSPLDWPLLKHLSVSVDGGKDTHLNRVLILVQTKFGNTLQDLHVNVSDNMDLLANNTMVEPLSMPNLKSFRVFSRRFHPIDYLLPATQASLETLIVEIFESGQISFWKFVAAEDAAVVNEDQIRIYEHRRQPVKSNVWILFPKLQKVQVLVREGSSNSGWYLCTRKQWEKNLANRR